MTVPNSDVRFGLAVDSDNSHHVHFRVFAATGGQHLGGCGSLVMTVEEFDVFRQLLAPQLTDRPDPAPATDMAVSGHGYVRPRLDGAKARCGGPGICSQCSREQAALSTSDRTSGGDR
jgi:hypothetical protein